MGGHHSTTGQGESSDMEHTVTGECPGQDYSSLWQEKTEAGSLLFHSQSVTYSGYDLCLDCYPEQKDTGWHPPCLRRDMGGTR